MTGNELAIANRDNSSVIDDGTDLGTQTFTISNTGDGALTINAITLDSVQAGDFSISGVTLPQVFASNTAFAFTLNFTPSAVGLRTATVNITNDDSDEYPYTFAVQGTGSQPAATAINLYLLLVTK